MPTQKDEKSSICIDMFPLIYIAANICFAIIFDKLLQCHNIYFFPGFHSFFTKIFER